MNCNTSSATLSWTASPNAVSYRGRALGGDGHTVTCDATTPGCQLNGLHCGQEYVFVITASDGSCESPDSAKNRHETGIALIIKIIIIIIMLTFSSVVTINVMKPEHYKECLFSPHVLFSSTVCASECVNIPGLCL